MRAADQLVDRQARRLAGDIPKRDVDAGKRLDRHALYRATNEQTIGPSDLISAIRDFAKENAEKKDKEKPRFPTVLDPSIEVEGTTIDLAHYVEKRVPSWFVGEGITDTLNQLIIVARRGSL